MFENIRADMMRVLRKEKGLINALHWLVYNYGFHALAIYRFGRWLGSMRKYFFGWAIAAPLYPLYWMLSVYARKAYGIDLDQSADIAPGLYISHFGGIEVRNCCIGPRCTIHQQVKLGATEATDKRLVIGKEVFIGAHARICADISVEDGATIGAGAVVTEDVPHHCLILGNPGYIVQRNYDNHSFL